MASDTKERILDAALTLFSQNGYEGTNLIDIAESVGLVKSGIYLCDREPEREEEAIQKIKDFIANFIKTYNL